MRSLTPGQEVALDWGIALGLAVIGWLQVAAIPFILSGPGGPGGPGHDAGFFPPQDYLLTFRALVPSPFSYALIGLACLPLGLRRKYPIPVLAASVLFAGVYQLTPNPPSIVSLAPLIALYTVGTLYERRAAVGAVVVTLAFLLPIALVGAPSVRLIPEAVGVIATIAFAAALGDATRNRRAYVAEVEQRMLAAERSRDEEARRRVEEERLRIARELHDVTAHSLSIIAVQAGAAEAVIGKDPDAARQSLATIRATSKASLDELRSIVRVLRGDEDGAPLAPVGSLGRLEELTSSVKQAGVHVALTVDELEDLPAFVEVSIYRIVQEALTNIVRHAKAGNAQVSITRVGGDVQVRVVDDGVGVTVDGGEGHGLLGMRERVIALGGTFSAAPQDGGGFEVVARIPLSEDQR